MTAHGTDTSGKSPLEGSEPNLFIAWGGEWSRRVARALYGWLPDMIDAARPWMSEESLRSGSTWFAEIKKQLATVQGAIVCLTPDNLQNYWIHFEAGAIANRSFAETRVMTFLNGVLPGEVRPPLSLFQAQGADKEQTLRLVRDINAAIGSTVTPERLAKRFDTEWPRLKAALDAAKPDSQPAEAPRPVESMFAEILGLMRSMDAAVSQSLETSQRAMLRSQGFVTSDYDRMISQVALAEASRQSGVLSSASELLSASNSGVKAYTTGRGQSLSDLIRAGVKNKRDEPEE